MGSRASKKRLGTRNKRRYVVVLAIVAVLTVAIGTGGMAAYATCDSWLQDLPDYQEASAYNLAQKTRVYASDGTTLLAEFYLEDRDPVTSDQISDYVLKGTVATEDERFYQHTGVDPLGIARAIVVNITGTGHEGASTITQQFVRNTVLSSEATEQTAKRKVREMYISTKLEEVYSKDEILLMYLNTINYGSGAYGIQAASHKYFSKDAKDLTLAESAALIGIPQSPTNNNPIDNPDACLQRRNLVLERMLSNGYITQADYDAAVVLPLQLNVTERISEDGIYAYPYFTSYVRQVLLEEYTEAEVFKGGLNVITTLDVNAQNAAEVAARNKEDRVDDDLEVALVATDPNTGFIKAMVGGRDYYTDEFNLATQATRQPGSSFKTFTLLSSIEDGIDPVTTYVNCGATADINGWNVENYGKSSYGTRNIQGAFTVSSNTGFARLVTLLTPKKVADMAKRCGIETTLEEVPSITLGSQGVTVREMAGAYGTVATGGIQHDAVAIQSITDSNGKTVFQADTAGKRAISPEVAAAATSVMETVVTSGTGTEAALGNGQAVAGKTGTSEEWRDSWFCGITPEYSVAIWLGCRQERSMAESYTATSVFSDFVSSIMGDEAPKDFPTAAKPTYRTLSQQELTTLGGYTASSSSANSGYYYNYGTGTDSGSSAGTSTAPGSASSSSAASSGSSAGTSGGSDSTSGTATGGGTSGGSTTGGDTGTTGGGTSTGTGTGTSGATP